MIKQLIENAKNDCDELILRCHDANDIVQSLEKNIACLPTVIASSPFFARTIGNQPQLILKVLCKASDVDFTIPGLNQAIAQPIQACQDPAHLDRVLRQIRYEKMLQILWLDQTRQIALDQTLLFLSNVADVLLQHCIQWHYQHKVLQHGYPQSNAIKQLPLIVLAMGKLGARELNYSSDIDLMFAYEENGYTQGRVVISNQEFFHQLVQQVYRSLNTNQVEGFVYRVDLRLRPHGSSGPLVMSFAAMEEYYQTQGREWERYALIKARAVIDNHPARRLLDLLRPFVYRRYLDFGAIDSLRSLKTLINDEVARKDRKNNLKLGPGGIREIEFVAQVFQLMRGGRDRVLQDRRTPIVLQLLSEKQYLSKEESQQLIAAWEFLRILENRIQQMYDHQRHDLPQTPVEQQRLVCGMGYETWQELMQQLDHYRAAVQRCYSRIFADRSINDTHQYGQIWQRLNDGQTQSDEVHQAVEGLGYQNTLSTLQLLGTLKYQGNYKRLSARGQTLMDELMPVLIRECAEVDQIDMTLDRILSVISTIAQRESYLVLLLEAPSARKQLIKLCRASSWLTQTIATHPELLDELIDHRVLYAPADKAGLSCELSNLLADLDSKDIEMQMERLRYFKQSQQLRIAAADIIGTLPLMAVSDRLTWLAENSLEVATELAWNEMIDRYGAPTYLHEGQLEQAGFAVIGFGKLGGIELGYGSDLDLVFLHNSQGKQQQTDGEKPVDNSIFFTRLAQRLVHFLSTLTAAGTLYEIDTRLRPNGRSGLLVSSLSSFSDYQQHEAWVWEHQALVRARPVTGDQSVGQAFLDIRRSVLKQQRDSAKLAQAVLQMRERMRTDLDCSQGEVFDLKQGKGGIVDIEFMVQYIVLDQSHQLSALLEYPDTIRLLETAMQLGLMGSSIGEPIKQAYQAYRAQLHRQVLQGQTHCVDGGNWVVHRQAVMAGWNSILGT